MNNLPGNIYIIGAGISGLVAARVLESRGYAATILESSNSPGGRVKTDIEADTVFDHGFQVLLTAYPMAQKYLDYKALDLKQFLPGALVFSGGKIDKIGDPLRDFDSLLPTLTSRVGSFQDKWKIFKLSKSLKRKSISEIFSTPEQSTLEYLRTFGFSERIIGLFFKPFFTGIFLEDQLRSSSRMFEFTFKMFSEGYAAIPAFGIGAISRQLADSLLKTKILYGQEVEQVVSGSVVLKGGEVLSSDATLVTVPFHPETGKLYEGALKWRHCDNLYFTVEKRTFTEGRIGLVAEKESLVNNLYYPFGQTEAGEPVLSVTVVKDHRLDTQTLIGVVREDLKLYCGIVTRSFLKHYPIAKALPDVADVCMQLVVPQSNAFEKVFMAGDYLLNGSLNAAIASGEVAAEALAEKLEAG